MTLGELHDRLDWTQADKSLAGWNKLHGEEMFSMDAEEVRRRRCQVIHRALYADDDEARAFCIKSLMGVGVWGQVLELMGKVGKVASDDIRTEDTEQQSGCPEEITRGG